MVDGTAVVVLLKCRCGWVCDYYVCWVYDVAGLFQLRERERERKIEKELKRKREK